MAGKKTRRALVPAEMEPERRGSRGELRRMLRTPRGCWYGRERVLVWMYGDVGLEWKRADLEGDVVAEDGEGTS